MALTLEIHVMMVMIVRRMMPSMLSVIVPVSTLLIVDQIVQMDLALVMSVMMVMNAQKMMP